MEDQHDRDTESGGENRDYRQTIQHPWRDLVLQTIELPKRFFQPKRKWSPVHNAL